MSMGDFFGEPIAAYTRKQAIADGVLVDATELARGQGFRIPVAFTAALWAACQNEAPGVDAVQGWARDVLWIAYLRVRAALKSRQPGRDSDGRLPPAFGVVVGKATYRPRIVFNPAEGFTIGFSGDF